jgi:hypothetical protein
MNKKHLSKLNSFKSGFGIFLFAGIFIIPMVLYWSLEKQNTQFSVLIFAFIVISRIAIIFLY